VSEWLAHEKDHDREHQVAKETAQRLERELKETAIRLEETVKAALKSHERIHAVEKEQVNKAETAMNERLERMNEFRAALQDAAARMVTRDVLDAYMKDREHRLQAVIDRIIALEKSQVSEERVDALREDSKRTRTGFWIAVAVLGLGFVLNLLVNLSQNSP